VSNNYYARLLERAAHVLGGVHALREHLDVSALQLRLWMQGRAKPPDSVFLRIADVLADRHLQQLQQFQPKPD